MEANKLTDRIMEFIKDQPFYFYDIVRHFENDEYRDILIAWSDIRNECKFKREDNGRYILEE